MDELDLINQDDPTLVPQEALMQPIDQVAAEVPEIMAVAAPEVQMGAESGLIPTPNQVQPSAVPGTTEMDWANAADVLDPFNQSTVEQVKNMTGAQFPTDIQTGMPLPEAAPIPIGQGEALVTPQDQLIQQKTGDVSRTVVEPTTGAVSALQGARNAVSAQDAAMAQEAIFAEQLANDKALMDAERLKVASEYATKVELLSQEAQKQAEQNRNEIARIRQEYASQPWQSFWGSKDIADKMMLSLGVTLGALSQSQIGGQNLAMAFLQSNIDDHNKSQSERFRMLEQQLNSAQANSVQAQAAIEGEYKNLIAARAAKYDQLDKQLAAISAKTNVPAARVAAEKARAETSLKSNKELFEMENTLSARTTNRMDIFTTKTMKGNPRLFVKANGEAMNDAEGKEYKMVLNIAPALKDVEAMEDQGVTNTTEYANMKKALMNESRDLGALKGMVEGSLLLARFDSAVDRAIAGNVPLQQYMRAVRKMMVDKLRLDSGASIAPSEYLSYIQTYLPNDITMNRTPETQKADLDQVRRYRRAFVEGALGKSGSATRLWYMEGQQ